jgi:hypothetical protein
MAIVAFHLCAVWCQRCRSMPYASPIANSTTVLVRNSLCKLIRLHSRTSIPFRFNSFRRCSRVDMQRRWRVLLRSRRGETRRQQVPACVSSTASSLVVCSSACDAILIADVRNCVCARSIDVSQSVPNGRRVRVGLLRCQRSRQNTD